jgi:hypothetical protein
MMSAFHHLPDLAQTSPHFRKVPLTDITDLLSRVRSRGSLGLGDKHSNLTFRARLIFGEWRVCGHGQHLDGLVPPRP